MLVYSDDEKIVLPITLLIIIVISLFIYFLLRKKSNKIRNIPLASIAIIILVLEVIKQYLSLKDGEWNAWTLPLHFCSLFLFTFPLMTLIPNKTIKNFGNCMSLVCCCWMTALFYVNPGTIIGQSSSNILGDFYSFHTFTYHHLVILYLLSSILLNQFKIPKNFYVYVIIGFITYATCAIPVAYKFNANFCNILYSNIPLMESLRVNTNQILYTFILFLIGTSMGLLTCFVYGKIRSKGGEN